MALIKVSTICCQFTIPARKTPPCGTTESLKSTEFVGMKLVLMCPHSVACVRRIILEKFVQRLVNGRTEKLPCRGNLFIKALEARKTLNPVLGRGEGWKTLGIVEIAHWD